MFYYVQVSCRPKKLLDIIKSYISTKKTYFFTWHGLKSFDLWMSRSLPVSLALSLSLIDGWPCNGNDSPPLRLSLFVWIVGVPARQTPVKLVSLEARRVEHHLSSEQCELHGIPKHNQSQTFCTGERKSSSSQVHFFSSGDTRPDLI